MRSLTRTFVSSQPFYQESFSMEKTPTQLRITLLGCSEKMNTALYDLMPEDASLETIHLTANHLQCPESILDCTNRPSVAVVDLSDLPIQQIGLIRDFAVTHPELPIIVLHAYHERPIARTILQNGAMAYLPVNTNRNELASAIDSVLAGTPYISERVGNL